MGLYFKKNFCVPKTTFHENKDVNQQKKLTQFFSTAANYKLENFVQIIIGKDGVLMPCELNLKIKQVRI